MARMMQRQALVRTHSIRDGKRYTHQACSCCLPDHIGQKLGKQQRAIEKREWQKDQNDSS